MIDVASAPEDEAVRAMVDRVRAALTGSSLREVRMFGAIAVMVDGAMAVAAYKDGSLLVRVDPTEDARLLGDPHASRAEMGAGRSMGEGWIRVDAAGLSSDASLDGWLECATGYLSRPQVARRGRAR